MAVAYRERHYFLTQPDHPRSPHTSGDGGGIESSLLVPTLQATGRALRLIKTAVLIAMDYKTTEWTTSIESTLFSSIERVQLQRARVEKNPETDDDNENGNDDTARFSSLQRRRTYWESETERRKKRLEEAQSVYATNSHPDLDLPSRLDVKRQEKQAMIQAAQDLADAEDVLASIGESRKSRIHKRAAQRLLKLCHDNRGVYIKIGQHLANLDYLIPQEYIETLSALFDNNPRTSYEDIKEVIRQDLGCNVEDIFESFDPDPIASASLAQVHIAHEKETGKKLAVKVQHRGLRETSAGDIYMITNVVRFAERAFEGFNWGWLADEIAPQLPKELDFTNEGRNAERAAKNIAKTGLDCVIPKIIWKHSSPRVLVMEFEEGFKATDVDAIQKSGLCKREIAKLISSVFSSQVFLSAWVHCDPHPANVLLRPNRDGKPQMVLVDHGLYRELDPEFCRRYAFLWKSLMLADLKGIKEACQSLGVGDKAYTLFAAMLTARPFDELIERAKQGSLAQNVRTGSRADKAVIRGYAQRYLTNIMELLGRIPRQMLLLLKMNDCLRHIDYKLGSPTNTLVVCGQYAARSIYEESLRNPSLSWIERLGAWWSYMRVLFRIQLHDAAVWWMQQKPVLRLRAQS